MRSTVRNYIQAAKARRDENGDEGFSLIELIVVVVILGILAAIAVPVFLGLQKQAEESSVETIAANAATQAASNIAQDLDLDANFAKLETTGGVTLTYIGTKIDDFCVTATSDTDATIVKTSGPGC